MELNNEANKKKKGLLLLFFASFAKYILFLLYMGWNLDIYIYTHTQIKSKNQILQLWDSLEDMKLIRVIFLKGGQNKSF